MKYKRITFNFRHVRDVKLYCIILLLVSFLLESKEMNRSLLLKKYNNNNLNEGSYTNDFVGSDKY